MHVWDECVSVDFHDIDYKNVVNHSYGKMLDSGGENNSKSFIKIRLHSNAYKYL